jgi:hypothetical protein
MSARKYLLDEHVGPRLQKALQRHSPDMVVWRIGDPGAPPLHSPDPEILIWCEEHGFSLITNNRASMPVHLREHLAAGRHIPAIFILNPNLDLGQTIDELILIWAVSESDEYADQLNYLPLSW